MLKGNKTYIIIILILFGCLIFFQINKPAPFSWKPTYSKIDKIPFGGYLLFEHLDVLFPNKQVVTQTKPTYNVLKGDTANGVNYIFITSRFQPGKLDAKKLMHFASKGNRVFIAANKIRGKLADTLNVKVADVYAYDDYYEVLEEDSSTFNEFGEYQYWFSDSTEANFTNAKLAADSNYFYDMAMRHFHFTSYDSLNTTVLGKDHLNNANFIKVEVGEGAIYLHTLPRVFSNYYIAHPVNHTYAFKALSYLPVADVYWDEYYKKDRKSMKSASPMRFILSNGPLTFAFYLLIGALLLYMIFNGKRKQRIIPVITPLENTSLKFVDIISSLYYNKEDHINIIHKKITYFLEYIRGSFNIKTNTFDEDFVRRISIRSGVDQASVQNLFKYIDHLRQKQWASQGELMQLNQMMEEFKRNSKR